MTKKNTLLLFTLFIGFCVLQSIHAATSATASFQITAVLVEPVDMAVNEDNSNISTNVRTQKTVAATLSTVSDPSVKVHVSVEKNDTIVACDSGACKGDKIELANLIFKNLGYSSQKKFELDAIDKLALNDQAGNYSGNVKVMLATI